MIEKVLSFNSERAAKAVRFTPATMRAALTRAESRVDFSMVSARAISIETEATLQVAQLTARAAKRIVDRIPELITSDVDAIGNLRIDSTDVGKIKATYRSMLERAWSSGLSQAMLETQKVKRRLYAKDERKYHFANLSQNATLWFDSNSFRMAGDLTDKMRGIIQTQLLQAVKSGKRPEQTASDIYAALIRKGMTTLEAMTGIVDQALIQSMTEEALLDALPTVNVPAYLNTLARTNTFEAMNEARFAEFTDPQVADFVVALQYSAVMDDRTTHICEMLDGAVYVPDSPVWETYRPPNHYNCRSLLVAVTTLDGWDGQESNPPSVEPQDGFK